MRALVLHLEGPMQSWGGPVAGDDRPSLDVPTRSGVLGLVAGALGIPRDAPERLAAVHESVGFAVRVDREGEAGVDFHTALEVPNSTGGVRSNAVLSHRHYLYDAAFTALLVERPGAVFSLDAIAGALRRPTFAPFLGRRACPPTRPIAGAIVEGSDWRALYDAAPLDERAASGPRDVHLDAALAPGLDRRPRRQRDVLTGRGPRIFRERIVHVARWVPPDRGDRAAASGARETIDPWMP